MKTLIRLLAFLVTAGLFADQYYWTSTGCGNWSDTTKWHKGTVGGETGTLPGVGDKVEVVSNCTITVDGEHEIASLSLPSKSASSPITVTLKGSGRLVLTPENNNGGTTMQIGIYSTLEMDGPDIYVSATSVQYCEGGTLIVRRGAYTPYTHYIKTAPGRLVIDGGAVTCDGDGNRSICLQNGWNGASEPVGFVNLKSGLLDVKCAFYVGTFTMSGGVWDRTFAPHGKFFTNLLNSAGLSMDISGGDRIVFNGRDTLPDAPDILAVSELVHTNAVNAQDWHPISESGAYSFGRIIAPKLTLCLTNDNIAISGDLLNVYSLRFSGDAKDVAVNIREIKVANKNASAPIAAADLNQYMHIDSRNAVRFSSATSGGTLKVMALSNVDCYWRFRKGVSASTTANDGGPANIQIGNPLFDAGAVADFDGKGNAMLFFSNYIGNGRNVQTGFSNQLARVSMSGGGELEMKNWAWNSRDYPFQVERLVLGTGAGLKTVAAIYAHIDANEVEMDSSNRLTISTPDMNNSDFPTSPLMTGPRHVNDFRTDDSRPSVTLETNGAADEWNFEWINGQPVVWRKGASQRASHSLSHVNLSKWRGTVDGNWSNDANWLIDSGKVKAANPLEQSMLFDGGYTNTRITVDEAVKAYQICVFRPTAPVAFVGEGSIEFGSNDRTSVSPDVWDVRAAVVNTSDNPIVFDVPVSLSASITEDRSFMVNQSSRGYVAFTKEFYPGDVLVMKGDVRIGGAAMVENVAFEVQGSVLPAKRTRLSVIPGGSVAVTRQTSLQSGGDVEISVHSNATFTVHDGDGDAFWGYEDERKPIWVKKYGRFDCRAPLGGFEKVSFKGDGEVFLADTGSKATADYPVAFDGVTFAVNAFTAGHPIELSGSPIWAARTDWSYALGTVSVPSGETLTVNTEDSETGYGHSVEIGSPVVADTLVKAGSGTLTLSSTGNQVGDVRVEAGCLALAHAQPFGSLAFASGTTLRLADASAPISTAGGLDLSGVSIEIGGALAAEARRTWMTVLAVPAGQTISGDFAFAHKDGMSRIVDTDDGGVALQVRRRPGFIFVVH